MSVKELFEAEYDAAPDTGQGMLLPWHLANAVMSELTKLRAREKQLEAQEQYATSRLCVAHRGHWQAGRCVICDLERAESRLGSEVRNAYKTGYFDAIAEWAPQMAGSEAMRQHMQIRLAEHVAYASGGAGDATNSTAEREIACLGGCGRMVPETHPEGIVTSWRCSACSPDGRAGGTVQMPSATAGEDREQKAPLRGRKPGDGCGKFW